MINAQHIRERTAQYLIEREPTYGTILNSIKEAADSGITCVTIDFPMLTLQCCKILTLLGFTLKMEDEKVYIQW